MAIKIAFSGKTLADVNQSIWEYAWSQESNLARNPIEFDPIAAEALRETKGSRKSHGELMADFEKGLILERLGLCEDNISVTAKALQLSRAGLHMKMKRYGLT